MSSASKDLTPLGNWISHVNELYPADCFPIDFLADSDSIVLKFSNNKIVKVEIDQLPEASVSKFFEFFECAFKEKISFTEMMGWLDAFLDKKFILPCGPRNSTVRAGKNWKMGQMLVAKTEDSKVLSFKLACAGGWEFKLSLTEPLFTGWGKQFKKAWPKYARQIDVDTTYGAWQQIIENCIAEVSIAPFLVGASKPIFGSTNIEELGLSRQKAVDIAMRTPLVEPSTALTFAPPSPSPSAVAPVPGSALVCEPLLPVGRLDQLAVWATKYGP